MKFLEFQEAFRRFPVIPVGEIEKHFPGFDRNNLSRWQEKGYLDKLRNGFYRLSRQGLDQEELFLIAGKIYAPSYVSLESALSWYGLIPEGAFSITSVSHLKTRHFDTPVARFEYRHLKRELLFGVRLAAASNFQYKIADPVKALLDFLYLRPDIQAPGHIEELRLNGPALKKALEDYPAAGYLERFHSPTLSRKIAIIRKMLPQ
jgi:predicted transcriptional regulator of viral defense system